MAAYMSSSSNDEKEQQNTHRRTYSADEDSLTIPRIDVGGLRGGESIARRRSEDSDQEPGVAR